MGDAVEGPDPKRAHRYPEQRLDAPAHLAGGLVGEGDGEYALCRGLRGFAEPTHAVHEHAGLAAPGAGQNQGITGLGRHRLALTAPQRLQRNPPPAF
jgi:hypothetical protein